MFRFVPAAVLMVAAAVSGCTCGSGTRPHPVVEISPTAFDARPGPIQINVTVTAPVDHTLSDHVTIRIARNSLVSTINLWGGDPAANLVMDAIRYSPLGVGAVSTHFIEVSCVEGMGTFDVVVTYHHGARNIDVDEDFTQPIQVDCRDPEPITPVSDLVAELTEIFVESPLGGADENRIIDLPSIAGGITAYKLDDAAEPSLWISQLGAKTQVRPVTGQQVLNYTFMLGSPFVGNQDLSCGNGQFWAFAGDITDIAGQNPLERLFVSGNFGLAPVELAKEGDPAPGLSGAQFGTFSAPIVDDCGDVLFGATRLGLGTRSVWRRTAGGLTKLVEENDPLPAAPAGGWRLTSGTMSYAPTAATTFVFIDDLRANLDDSTHSGIWEIDNLGVATCRAYTNGNGIGCDKFILGQLGSPSFASGSLVFAYTQNGTVTYVIRKTGEEELDPTFKGPGGDGQGLGIQTPSPHPLACPITGDAYFTAGFIDAVGGTLTGGVFRYASGEVRTLGRADEFPGVDLTFGPLANLELAMTTQCQLVVLATNSLVDGIWMTDTDGGWLKVVQTGDQLTTTAGVKTVQFVDMVTRSNGFDHRPQSIDEAGNLAFLVTFDDGLKAVYSSELVPAP